MRLMLFLMLWFFPLAPVLAGDGVKGGDPDAVEFVSLARQACRLAQANDSSHGFDGTGCLNKVSVLEASLDKGPKPLVGVSEHIVKESGVNKAAVYDKARGTVTLSRPIWSKLSKQKKLMTAAVEMAGLLGSGERYLVGEEFEKLVDQGRFINESVHPAVIPSRKLPVLGFNDFFEDLPKIEVSTVYNPPNAISGAEYDEFKVYVFRDNTVGVMPYLTSSADPNESSGSYAYNTVRVPRDLVQKHYRALAGYGEGLLSFLKMFVPSSWLNQDASGKYWPSLCQTAFLSGRGGYLGVFGQACVYDFFATFRFRFQHPDEMAFMAALQGNRRNERLESLKVHDPAMYKLEMDTEARFRDGGEGYHCRATCVVTGTAVNNFQRRLQSYGVEGNYLDLETARRDLSAQCKPTEGYSRADLAYAPACYSRR